MNAIVSLCHFCELHGPAVLFCTRAFADQEPENNDGSDTESRDDQDSGLSSWYRSGDWNIPNPTETTSAPTSPVTDKSKIPDLCEACRSFEVGESGFVSSDAESQVTYVSSQYPHQADVYRIVRQACIRSLSCEVSPGRDCPIFFGDDQGIHVLSYKFHLKDFHSRGLQSNYSIIVVMTDKIFLLNSWPFLTKHIRHIIDHLKSKADVVNSGICPFRHHAPSGGHGARPFLPPRRLLHHRPLVRSISHFPKSLKELTNDKWIFQWLHKAFTWLLKAGSNRLMERMLEGPPTEESVIDLEKQEETEEGFVKLFSHDKDDPTEYSSAPHSDDEDADVRFSPVFTHPRCLLKVLGYGKFNELLHHIVIGHQAIVRGRQRKLIHSVVDCLKIFLPKGCCHAVYFTRNYIDWRRCNFIGMPLDAPLPSNLPPCVVLEINDGTDLSRKGFSSGLTRSMLEEEDEDVGSASLAELESYSYSVSSPNASLLTKGPTVVDRMVKTLLCEDLRDSLIEPFFTCLKEEWLNKAKVLYKYTKVGGNRIKDDSKLLHIVGAKQEDRRVLEFWMTGLSRQHNNSNSS